MFVGYRNICVGLYEGSDVLLKPDHLQQMLSDSMMQQGLWTWKLKHQGPIYLCSEDNVSIGKLYIHSYKLEQLDELIYIGSVFKQRQEMIGKFKDVQMKETGS